MFSIVFLVLCVLVAVGLVIAGQGLVKLVAAPVIFVGVLVVVFASTVSVQPKNIGVETKFGHVQKSTLEPGLHWKAPWAKVIELDGTIQVDQYTGQNCIPVRIGDGSQSCVSLTHRWQIDPQQASTIYASYRSNDPTKHLRDSVVSSELVSVVQDVMKQYNPVANLQVIDASNAGATPDFAPDYDSFAKQIHDGLVARYGDKPLVNTLAITISGVSLSTATQQKINAFIAEVAQTRIAAQKINTAKNDAAANSALAASVSNDPNVLTSKCLDIISQADKDNYQLPVGFQCFTGGSSAVVVPSAK